MSTDYILSPHALDDLYDIWCYISEQSSAAIADRVEERLFTAFAVLTKMRGQGHRRADLTDLPVLFFPVYSYLVVTNRMQIPWSFMAFCMGRATLEEC